MATVLDIATAALQRLGVIDATETPSSADSSYALSTLNLLVDKWGTEKLLTFSTTRSTWTIVSGTAAYTVGSGGAVNITRPPIHFIEHVRFQDTSVSPTLEMRMDPLTVDAYAAIPQKDTTSNYPTAYYYNPTWSSGLASLTLYPVPTSSTLQGVIYYDPFPVSEFTALSDSVSLPPGYRLMMVTNLAMEMAPAYKVKEVGILAEQARDSKAWVKRGNNKLMDLWVDAGALADGLNRWGRYSIYTGP